MRANVRTRLIIFFGVSGLGIIVATGVLLSPLLSAQSTPRAAAIRQLEALKSSGLAGAAAITGSFVTTAGFPRAGEPMYVEDLVAISHAIVVGWVDRNLCVLNPDGRSASTFYRIRVETVLKGRINSAEDFTLVTPGGKVSFPSGDWAEIRTPGFARPRNQRRYLLFVRAAPTDLTQGLEQFVAPGGAYSPAGGGLGVYDVTGNPRIKPNGSLDSVFAKALWKEDISADAFLERIRQVTHR